MGIQFNSERGIFNLQGPNSSYVIGIEGDYPVHLHWGARVEEYRGSAPLAFIDRGFAPNREAGNRDISADLLPLEYHPAHAGDFRPSSIQIRYDDGGETARFTYMGHSIMPGKPELPGLPAVYVEQDDEAQTLGLFFADETSDVEMVLYFTVFRDYDAISRYVHISNKGNNFVTLGGMLSAQVDFRDSDFELLNLWGGHVNERNIQRMPVPHGTAEAASLRGASSHHFSPFMALCRPGAGEDSGDVYGFSLVYSGNFTARTHLDQSGFVRVQIGINDSDFSWRLEPGEGFTTPEAVMVYSPEGLGGMSRTYHTLYRTRLARGEWRDKERPVLLNNWEATYFDFDAEKIYSIAKTAAEQGIELFVLDDGWFGKRDADNSSLGDWVVDKRKLPDGLAALAKRIMALGIRFGLWFEPEMVNEESDLYRAHPDWVLKAPRYPASYGRDQFVLDLSREDVCEYIIEAVSAVLREAEISYVKWDMNRHIVEAGSALLPPERQGEVRHRYMLGLYRVMETLTKRFPNVLFESCSGGGGRFDAGMLHYMPQTWTSDNTDAVCRLKIQHGTSLEMPVIAMASHVAAVPNHQVGRITPLKTRAVVAMGGNLGYELDITRMGEEELAEVKQQVAMYKAIRPTVQFGAYYRLLSPFEGNEAAWNFVAPDGGMVVASYVKVLAQPGTPVRLLRLKGLDANARYEDVETGEVFGGDELMRVGVTLLPQQKDFASWMKIYKRV